MKDKILKNALLLAITGLMTACGGSDNTATVSPVASTSTIQGTITGFGSIYVNGIEFETNAASIVIDGVPDIETSLGIGDVVILQGSINDDGLTGVATAVSSADELEGYVLDLSGLVASIGTINVMGQTVEITIDTVFDSNILNTIDELSINDIVEVSGYSDGNGNVLATRIETKRDKDKVELKGFVSGLNVSNLTFKIGAMVVDYSSAFEVPGNLIDGLLVEVKTQSPLEGSLVDGFTLIASKVEIEESDGADDESGDEIKRQGLVTDVTDSTFLFNGELIEIASLKINDDFDIQTLRDGLLITVEGSIDANGVFIIKKIEDYQSSKFELKGEVSAKTENTVNLIINGVETTFIVNNTTRMHDKQNEEIASLHYFSLADVALGEFVEIKYYVDDSSGDNIATELVREDKPSPIRTRSGL